MKTIKFDCRYFSGDKPCRFKARCISCKHYSSMDKRILIIKLASAGDVLRTTSLLAALKKKYPACHISWLVKHPAQELLETNPLIDRLLVYGLETVILLKAESFDLVISLDKAIEAVSLAALIKADKKYGFGLNEKGKIYPFNKESEYSFMLGLDNNLKFHRNQKTYQEMIFEISGLNYKNEEYELMLSPRELDFADNLFRRNKLDRNGVVIGINTGAGTIFANKHLSFRKTVGLIRLLKKQIKAKILLLGGPLEKKLNRLITARAGSGVINGGCENSLKEFSALVNKCSVVITADTLALHIAIALKRPVAAYFGPTCHQEIDFYNRGIKVVTGSACAPCYRNQCDKLPTCMDDINLGQIVKAVKCLLGHKG